MAISSFEVQVRHHARVAIIDLQGEINAFAEKALSAAYDEAVSQKPEAVLLNFRLVDYINSTGIALIVNLLKLARQNRYRLCACDLSEHYTEIFQITRLSDFMPLFPDETSAFEGIRTSI